jgi:neutral ceramidase
MMEAGAAKKDITYFEEGLGMFGYGMDFHVMKGIKTKLYARAFVFRNSTVTDKIAFVNVDLMSISTAVRKGVLKKLKRNYSSLGYNDHNVMLTATHTHNGPGGFSHYAFYNLTIKGFVPKVYNIIVDGIVAAIIEADKNLKSANIYYGEGNFEADKEVAFNRSIKAYNHNPDVEKVSLKNRHLAIDRSMSLLRIDGLDGIPIGCISWFGVHPTNIGNDQFLLCGDNKGYAASFMEEAISASNFIAAFPQKPCGDVSPNFHWNFKRNRMCGKYSDDYESAAHNGKLQFEKAKEIYDQCINSSPVIAEIDSGLLFVNFNNVTIEPEFTGGLEGERTGPGSLGVGFLKGTTDGKGLNPFFILIFNFLVLISKCLDYIKAFFAPATIKERFIGKYKYQGNKEIIIETCERKILGYSDLKVFPKILDKSVATFRNHYENGSLGDKPWAPNVLPLQIFILGKIAIAGMSGELTTVSGKRLKKTIQQILEKRGVEQLILSPYANAYSGYVTTYEEYQTQCYEGGHTMYGKWTLAAYQTKFQQLCLEMLKPKKDRIFDSSIRPVKFKKQEIKKRTRVV